MNKCKHTVRYRRYESDNNFDVKAFLKGEYYSEMGPKLIAVDCTYFDLSEEDKKEADKKQEEHPLFKCNAECIKT